MTRADGEPIDARWRPAFERLRLWRRASAWAPILWFPAALYALLTEAPATALTFAFAGGVFALIARSVFWASTCPRCSVRFGWGGEGFAAAWNDARCAACGLSLFELRRSGTAKGGR